MFRRKTRNGKPPKQKLNPRARTVRLILIVLILFLVVAMIGLAASQLGYKGDK